MRYIVDWLLCVVQGTRQHPGPLLDKQACSVEVMEKYPEMKRGRQRVVQFVKAMHIQHQLENINAPSDSVLQGVCCAWTE